jgi:hypothetical protein
MHLMTEAVVTSKIAAAAIVVRTAKITSTARIVQPVAPFGTAGTILPSTVRKAHPVVKMTVGIVVTVLRCQCEWGRGNRSIRKMPKRKKGIFKKNKFTRKPILNRHLVIPQGLGRTSDSRGQSPNKPILDQRTVNSQKQQILSVSNQNVLIAVRKVGVTDLAAAKVRSLDGTN